MDKVPRIGLIYETESDPSNKFRNHDFNRRCNNYCIRGVTIHYNCFSRTFTLCSNDVFKEIFIFKVPKIRYEMVLFCYR